MASCVTMLWRLSSGPRKRPIRTLSTNTASIFEPIPKEELVPKFRSRLRDRQFLPGSSDGGFHSLPLGVRVNNKNQSSLPQLAEKCMGFIKENFSRSPAILFRGLPAKTAEDFSIIAKTSEMKYSYMGGTAYRTVIDKKTGVSTSSEDTSEYTIEVHNEQSYSAYFPSKVSFSLPPRVSFSFSSKVSFSFPFKVSFSFPFKVSFSFSSKVSFSFPFKVSF